MVDLVMLQVVRDLVAIFGVIAGFSYYVLTVRNSQRMQKMQLETRQAQLFMQIYSLRHSTDYFIKYQEFLNREWTDYDEAMEKFGNPEDMAKTLSLGAYFEGIGVLVKRGLLDPTLVDDLLSINIFEFWEKIEPLVIERRKRMNKPTSGEWMEYLYNEIRKIAEEQHPELRT